MTALSSKFGAPLSPGEETREFYREQGRKQERDRMGFALVQILADREKAAIGGEYSKTFSFFDIMRIVEGI